jgi:hypothetical protein
VLDAPASNIDCFLLRDTCVSSSAEQDYFEHSEVFSPLKTLIGRQYSFLKDTQYSQGNNVLDNPASNLYGVL